MFDTQVDSQSMLECFEMFRAASIMSGAVGLNVNIANVLTGVFLATGQDVAAVEGSIAQLIVERSSEQDVKTHGKPPCVLSLACVVYILSLPKHPFSCGYFLYIAMSCGMQ